MLFSVCLLPIDANSSVGVSCSSVVSKPHVIAGIEQVEGPGLPDWERKGGGCITVHTMLDEDWFGSISIGSLWLICVACDSEQS